MNTISVWDAIHVSPLLDTFPIHVSEGGYNLKENKKEEFLFSIRRKIGYNSLNKSFRICLKRFINLLH